jgi:DNA segregation ATPase FtsK/SpoIIIE, S-DNA-T family
MPFFIPGIRALWPKKAKRSAGGAKAAKTAAAPEARDGVAATPRKGRAQRGVRTYAREASALVLIAAGLYCALALGSYRADPLRPDVHGDDWVGPVGELFARGTVAVLGVVAWLVPLELVLVARPLLGDRPPRLGLARFGGDVLIVVIAAALTAIAFPLAVAFGRMPLGGLVGELFGEVLRGLFSTAGSFLIGGTVVALILVERATFSFIELWQATVARLVRIRGWLARVARALGSAWARARDVDRKQREEEKRLSEPLIVGAESADAVIAAFADDGFSDYGLKETTDSRLQASASSPSAVEPPAPRPIMVDRDAPTPSPPDRMSTTADLIVAAAEPSMPVQLEPELQPEARSLKSDEPTIVDTSAARKTRKAKKKAVAEDSGFRLPPTDLLDPMVHEGVTLAPERLKETARLLEKTLLDYGVEGRVQEIHPGPTVTMFEVSPAAGTKVSKVASLADDLALGLSKKVRIVAPIPGKNRIGFEVPNEQRVPVNLRELVESQDFMGLDAPLPCVLGRDIIGRPYFADLAAMPHVIVAGATGAGKSVALNVMLVSMLYRRTPEEMKMLMIDPKVVELAPFDRIPHLLLPVVTDMKQAAKALHWAVDEMERRYQLFADAGTRNIITYNRWVKRVLAGELPAPRAITVTAVTMDGGVVDVPAREGDVTMPDRLPYIVVVVEEFADLMMTQGKEVEASVARLAQKARAAGIHVILATQRPSVDVITGMIKANFPTRIAFRVAQRVDSRTILDAQGAEALLGRGDMLVKMNGSSELKRVQCPFVSEDEVQRVTDLLRAQGEPEYDDSILRAGDDEDEPGENGDAEGDALYDQAVRVVADTQKCSTSWIQRKLGIGYNRAAKIVETMEKKGLIGPPNGSKPRDIYVSPQ